MPKFGAKPMSNTDDDAHRWLTWLLNGGGAHVKFDAAVRDLSPSLRGKRPSKLPFSAWELLEHMRIAQDDILSFCVNPEYKELEWPAAYWPKRGAPSGSSDWDRSVRVFRSGVRRMARLVNNPETDLHLPIPWGTGQTLFREALLLADHNAYHLGEIIIVRRLLGAWPK